MGLGKRNPQEAFLGWHYSGNPGSSAKDAVRFFIGDTDPTPKEQLLTDEEIQYFLAMYNNTPLNAAIRCCEAIMAKASRLVDETVGPVKVTYSQRAKAYRDMRQDLIKRIATEDMNAYAGGISRADKETNNQNNDLVRPEFRKRMMTNRLVSPFVNNSYDSWLWYEG